MTELTVEERLDRLESFEAIRKLKYVYAQACDNKFNLDEIVSLFVEDGIWENPADGRFVGHKAIKEYFSDAPERIPFAGHLMLNADLSVDGDIGHGRWWMLQPCVQILSGVEKAVWFAAEYDESYRRVDGRWYFAHMVCNPRFMAPAADGDWAANWRETSELGRDRFAS